MATNDRRLARLCYYLDCDVVFHPALDVPEKHHLEDLSLNNRNRHKQFDNPRKERFLFESDVTLK